MLLTWSFTQLLNKYCVPGTGLGTGDGVVSKADLVPALRELQSSGRLMLNQQLH